MLTKICLAVLAVLCYVSSASAIQCFVCNSVNDTKCMGDDPHHSYKKDCSDLPDGNKYTMCRKIVQHIDFEVNQLPPDHRTIRSCGWVEGIYGNKCYSRAGFGGRQEVCACDTDGCNSAPGVVLPSMICLALLSFTARALLF